jgi:hypothetical protein
MAELRVRGARDKGVAATTAWLERGDVPAALARAYAKAA